MNNRIKPINSKIMIKKLISDSKILYLHPAKNGHGKRGHVVADTLLLMMFLGRANERDKK